MLLCYNLQRLYFVKKKMRMNNEFKLKNIIVELCIKVISMIMLYTSYKNII